VRDSLGIAIVENLSPASAEPPFTLDSIPVIDIGRDADNPHEELSGFVFPVRLSDGRVVVGNGGTRELRVFDSQGRWLHSIGREGEGPGEFRGVGRFHIGAGDTLYVYDMRLRRLSVFSPDGTFQRSLLMQAPSEMTGLRTAGVLVDGRVVARTQRGFTSQAKEGMRRDTVSLFVFDAAGRLDDTVGQYPGREEWIIRSENSVTISDWPFGKDIVALTHQSRIIVGTTDSPEVLILQADGTLERIIRWAATDLPVTAADIDAFVRRAGEGWNPGSETFRDEYLEKLTSVSFPATKPAYTDALVSSDGTLWLRKYDDPSLPDVEVFEVFDADGVWLGAVRMPPRFTLTQLSGEYAIGKWNDPDEVQHVRVYRLTDRH
jgi:hypothetical protein